MLTVVQKIIYKTDCKPAYNRKRAIKKALFVNFRFVFCEAYSQVKRSETPKKSLVEEQFNSRKEFLIPQGNTAAARHRKVR